MSTTTISHLLPFSSHNGAIWRLGQQESLRYVGSVRNANLTSNNEIPLSFNPDLYLPLALPQLQHAANPVTREQTSAHIDAARVCSRELVAHGHGKLLYFDCVLFDGVFRDGFRHGQGTGLIFRAEQQREFVGVYSGNWRYGLRNGFGRMSFTDGRVFEGTFVDDRICGVGEMKFADGASLLATFDCDARAIGTGVFTWADGQKELQFYSNQSLLRHRAATALEAQPIEAKLRAQLDLPTDALRSPSVGGVAMALAALDKTGGASTASSSSPPAAAAAVDRGDGGIATPAPSAAPGTGHAFGQPLTLAKKARAREFAKLDAPSISARLRVLGVGDISITANEDSFFVSKENGGTAVDMLVDTAVIADPLVRGFRQAASDAMSIEAIKNAVNAVEIVNDASAMSGVEFALVAKKLTIKLPLFRGGSGTLDASKLQKFLEANV